MCADAVVCVQTECLVCPAGSYSTTAGASNCTMAPPGYYSPQNGTEPLPCAVNTYAAGTGSSACTVRLEPPAILWVCTGRRA